MVGLQQQQLVLLPQVVLAVLLTATVVMVELQLMVD
jgi:hypothetical protein